VRRLGVFTNGLQATEAHTGFVAQDEVKAAARAWIDKLCVKNGTYPPDSYPNPGESTAIWSQERFLSMRVALAFHNAQLEASAFSEEFDPESFEDLTLPKVDMIHKVRSRTPALY